MSKSEDFTEILRAVDHTLLTVTATWNEIKTVCDDGIRFGVASVCIPPSFVERAKAYVYDRLKICTVIGFPNGYNTTESKVFEAAEAIRLGADEIDMVINIGDLKAGSYDSIETEIRRLKEVVGDRILKVIIEACLLTDGEKIKMCEIVSSAGADYIKTSTGFSTGGATRGDVGLFAKHVAPGVKIKAAGGIKSFSDAEDFIRLGAERLGTSTVVRLVKNEQAAEY